MGSRAQAAEGGLDCCREGALVIEVQVSMWMGMHLGLPQHQGMLQVKRESWLAEKTKEIKDITIKGLEPEIQTLVQRHRKELVDVKEVHMLDTKRQLDALSEQHNVYVR